MIHLHQIADIIRLATSIQTTRNPWNKQIIAALALKGIHSETRILQGASLVVTNHFACYQPPMHCGVRRAFCDLGTALEKQELHGGILLVRRKMELFITEWNSRSGIPIPIIFLPPP